VRSRLVIGADGRHSIVRRSARLEVVENSPPMDVLWFRISRLPGEELPFFRLRRWFRPGLLCIGDAAHAMSPAGGVGINLAVQDAVATSNILGPSLRRGVSAPYQELRRVQRTRAFPARIPQTVQVRALRGLYPKNLHDEPSGHIPLGFRLLESFPPLRHITGRFIGIGVRPEHIRQ
jgi:2-polyprenyl-6-methoxyphenol hydroxylase-like FAD-dependent oxidoreductase